VETETIDGMIMLKLKKVKKDKAAPNYKLWKPIEL
jgi:hypothetical protein